MECFSPDWGHSSSWGSPGCSPPASPGPSWWSPSWGSPAPSSVPSQPSLHLTYTKTHYINICNSHPFYVQTSVMFWLRLETGLGVYTTIRQARHRRRHLPSNNLPATNLCSPGSGGNLGCTGLLISERQLIINAGMQLLRDVSMRSDTLLRTIEQRAWTKF